MKGKELGHQWWLAYSGIPLGSPISPSYPTFPWYGGTPHFRFALFHVVRHLEICSNQLGDLMLVGRHCQVCLPWLSFQLPEMSSAPRAQGRWTLCNRTDTADGDSQWLNFQFPSVWSIRMNCQASALLKHVWRTLSEISRNCHPCLKAWKAKSQGDETSLLLSISKGWHLTYC